MMWKEAWLPLTFGLYLTLTVLLAVLFTILVVR